MLLDDVPQTLAVATRSLECARRGAIAGITQTSDVLQSGVVDRFVQGAVSATCGNLYKPLIGKLRRYPIPELRMPLGHGRPFLDIGCNWGRWSIAAARKGYMAIGIDPSLDAVLAARRISQQLRLNMAFVVGDARYLPFAPESFDTVFSYSVFQHFSRSDAFLALRSASQALRHDGVAVIQMANRFGCRSLYQQARRRFREGTQFEVRYWTLKEMRKVFSSLIGEPTLSIDGFLGLGIQTADLDLLPFRYRIVVRTSKCLRRVAVLLPSLIWLGDSIYVTARKQIVGRSGEMTHDSNEVGKLSGTFVRPEARQVFPTLENES
jgi:SAM-dependent methyltransferase